MTCGGAVSSVLSGVRVAGSDYALDDPALDGVASIRIRCQTDPRPRGKQQIPDTNQGDHAVVHVQSSDRVGGIQTHHLFCFIIPLP